MFATIYTDASGGIVNEKQTYSYSYYVKCDKGVISGQGIIEEFCEDINKAEMFAIVQGIKNALKKFSNINRILVVTDSISAQYSLWKGSKKAKYQNIIEEFKSLERKVDKIMIKWTKGHRHDCSDRAYLNNRCDLKANSAIRKASGKTPVNDGFYIYEDEDCELYIYED
jgi:ribonuclease HI